MEICDNFSSPYRLLYFVCHSQVYGRLAARRAEELREHRVPIVDERQLSDMLSAYDLPTESVTIVTRTLESYGFLKRLRTGQLLVDPVTWMTMVLGEFLHPVQTLPLMSNEGPFPALSLSEATEICSGRLELPARQVLIKNE